MPDRGTEVTMVAIAFTAAQLDDDRRGQTRAPLPGSVAYLSSYRLLIARLGDLSATGAFLRTLYPDPVGTRGTVDLELVGERVQVPVEVVRVSFAPGGTGMGVQFVDLARDVRRRLIDRVAHG